LIRNLTLIKEIRETERNGDFYPYIGVVIQQDNLSELPLFVEMAREFGFGLIKFSKLDPYYSSLNTVIPSNHQAEKALVQVLKKANESHINLYVPSYGNTPFSDTLRELVAINRNLPKDGFNNPDRFVKYPDRTSRECAIPWSETMITPEGKVVVGCCSGFVMGDLTRESFDDVWNNERYMMLRETVNSEAPLEFCDSRVCHFRR
jgi:MoaA/NifB/PqqE/SkfB family radical SAM enzyme